MNLISALWLGYILFWATAIIWAMWPRERDNRPSQDDRRLW